MTSEKYTVSGSEMVEKIKQLIHEGNIRRVRVIYQGRTVLEIPLSIGAPAAASERAVGQIARIVLPANEKRPFNGVILEAGVIGRNSDDYAGTDALDRRKMYRSDCDTVGYGQVDRPS